MLHFYTITHTHTVIHLHMYRSCTMIIIIIKGAHPFFSASSSMVSGTLVYTVNLQLTSESNKNSSVYKSDDPPTLCSQQNIQQINTMYSNMLLTYTRIYNQEHVENLVDTFL